jgi:hypothetical protein
MNRLSPEETRTIEAKLRAAGAVLPCPGCGRSERRVLDGYIIEYTQSQLRNMVISGDNRMSCVATVCLSCGYLAEHVLDVLRYGGV